MDILVQPLNRVIRAEPGVNLLDALRAAQVPMSYSCLSGRCGICRCRVLSGEVLDGGREQQRPLDGVDGAVLACQTYVTEPCTIEVPAPEEAVVHRARVAKATVVAIEPLAADIRRLLLKVAKPIAFSPGQYMQLGFTPTHVRPYSMANLPGEQLLEFHIQLMPQGRVSGYIAGQQRWCGIALFEPLDDGGRLDHQTLVGLQHGHQLLRVDGLEGISQMLLAPQVNRNLFVGQPLEVERNAQAVGGSAAEEGIEFHAQSLFQSLCQSRAILARLTTSPNVRESRSMALVSSAGGPM